MSTVSAITPPWSSRRLTMAVAMCLVLGAGTAFAGDLAGGGGPCSATALAQFAACRSEVRDDVHIARAICINISDEVERQECFDEASTEGREGNQLCRQQRAARLELCDALGQDRYDPDFDPADFDDDFTNLTTPNPHFPLDIGNVWVYQGGDETITVEVLDETKLIEDVTCIVVNDVVEEGGEVIEDTDDWYGQDRDGNIWYLGEISLNFEDGFLVDIDGSWRSGFEDAYPGIIMPGKPRVKQRT